VTDKSATGPSHLMIIFSCHITNGQLIIESQSTYIGTTEEYPNSHKRCQNYT